MRGNRYLARGEKVCWAVDCFRFFRIFFFLNYHVYEFSKYLKSICKNNCDSTLKFARKITGICLEIVICRHRCINFSGLSKPHLTSVQPREILGELLWNLFFPPIILFHRGILRTYRTQRVELADILEDLSIVEQKITLFIDKKTN